MCGIFGYIGKKNHLKVCLEGLKRLEYRGYDSAGIAGIENGVVQSYKKKGRIFELEKAVLGKTLDLQSIIGHTRWATHGKVTNANAHPHTDMNSSLALVHNGIIENHDELKRFLLSRNYHFQSDTDTEVIAHLISYHYKNDLIQAFYQTLKQLKGSFAIALIHKNHPDQILTASRDSPLSIGIDKNKKEKLISSDPNAFLGKNLEVIYLSNNEMALITADNIRIWDGSFNEITKQSHPFENIHQAHSKNGFSHFMLKEIHDQPFTLQAALEKQYSQEFGTADFQDLNFSAKELMETKHVLIIACGSSWHAGCIGASLLEDMARIPSQAEIASELRFKNPIISNETLVIAISQSGETADTLAAIREAKAKGAKILGICNNHHSTLTREAQGCIYLKAGPEISVCSTKTFTSQVALLTLFALYMARLRHMKKEEGQIFLRHMLEIPALIKKVLQDAAVIEKLAYKYAKYDNFFFLGRRHMYFNALEASLKLKEISYLNAHAYPAGELKHGPLALLCEDLPVIAFCANNQTYDKMLSNLMEVQARGSPIVAFTEKRAKDPIDRIVNDKIILPSTIDELATFPTSVAGQLFAYYIAKKRKRDIDHPRNLAKSVTVE